METESKQVILEAISLRKAYGDTVALSDLDLSIYRGECVALLGPNGAGKTTACDILSGLILPDTGKVVIDGMTYQRNYKVIQNIIGVHQQECHLYGKYTVEETIALFSSFYSKASPINELLCKLGLDEFKNHRLESLSFGQKQRVYLGCSFVHKPKVLLLDEPTTGLDLKSRHVIWQIIEELIADGCSVLLTTHNMHEAERLSDRVYILDKGKIIISDTTKKIVEKICGKDILSFKLKDENPELIDRLTKELPWFSQSRKVGNKYYVASNCAPSLMKDLSEIHEKHNIICSLSLNTASLEDVFLKLTGRIIQNDK